MLDKLEQGRILDLLAEADVKWFTNHPSYYDYREHLEFTANYVVRNYSKKPKKKEG